MNSPSRKLTISIAMILIGASLAVFMTQNSESASSNEGILIDFMDWEITFVETEGDMDSLSALTYACSREGYQLEINGTQVISINNMPESQDETQWSLFVVNKGDITWNRVSTDPSEIIINEYSAVAWGLCGPDEYPSPAVDATGVNFYNYPQAMRVVSLAPSSTETICAVGAIDTIVGTDQYSNYPAAVVDGQNRGSIAIVGGYTNPSYELIVQLNPDLVICTAGQASHLAIAEKMRSIGVNVIVSFDGESIESILNNTYMIGIGLGYEMSTDQTIDTIENGLGEIKSILDNYFQIRYPDVMISLSTVKSPWVSGSNTYISDILTFSYSNNVYSSLNGWVQINSESIVQYNPTYILIISSEYSATEEDYQAMLDALPAEWKSTEAYLSGNIFLYTGEATDLASRPSVRVAQLTELISRTLHPGAFADGIEVPKYIGDDYRDYLIYTKDTGFD